MKLCHLATMAVCLATVSTAFAQKEEVRGVWITNVDSNVLLSKRSIAEGMEALKNANINIVYPVVWNKAMTMYPSPHAATVTGTVIDPVYGERDPLQELLVEAHRHGIEVVPWFEFGFATSYNADGGVIIKNRPGWAALDQDGKLATKNNFEWMNAFDPEVQEFMAGMLLEVAERYDIDGVQGDDRLPAQPSLAGYDINTMERYKRRFGKLPPKDIKDPQWVQWRADILSDWLATLYNRIKAIDENITVSMSPSYYPWALEEYLQDSYAWTVRGLADTIHPQAYRYDLAAYKSIVDNLVSKQFTTPEHRALLSPGILVRAGSYRIPTDYFLAAIDYNRANGINGEVHFFYEGLRQDNNELLRALVERPVFENGVATLRTEPGPYAEPAILPYRDGIRRPGGYTIEPQKPQRGDVSTNGALQILRYRLQAPAAAVYNVYAEVPWDYSRTLTVEIAPRSRNATRSFARIEPTEEHRRGLIQIGRVDLTRRNSAQYDVTIRQPDNARLPEGMNLVLILDRKASPDVKIRYRDLRRWQ